MLEFSVNANGKHWVKKRRKWPIWEEDVAFIFLRIRRKILRIQRKIIKKYSNKCFRPANEKIDYKDKTFKSVWDNDQLFDKIYSDSSESTQEKSK